MFNIAFPELIVIVVVSLIVIGPDKLPKVAQTLGAMLGRMQRFMSDVKNDIDQELKNNDLQRLREELKLQNEGLNEELRKGMQPVADVVRQPQAKPTDSESSDVTAIQDGDKNTEQRPHVIKPEGSAT
jgi:sec-independent protein translocase protein TatB